MLQNGIHWKNKNVNKLRFTSLQVRKKTVNYLYNDFLIPPERNLKNKKNNQRD